MAERRAWYQSPWTWGGCGCCVGCVVLPVVLFALVGGGAFFALWNTGITRQALERARSNPELTRALGEPVEAGWWIQGDIHLGIDEGQADFSIPISGPEGEGRLYVVAERRDGEWIFRDLYAVIEGREEPIDLLE